jgi:hypothetical protein
MIHDDPSSARVVHPYLIGDELVGDGIPNPWTAGPDLTAVWLDPPSP